MVQNAGGFLKKGLKVKCHKLKSAAKSMLLGLFFARMGWRGMYVL